MASDRYSTLSILVLLYCTAAVFSQRLVYSHCDSVNDKDQFKLDVEAGSYKIEASWFKVYANNQDANKRGRSKIRKDSVISGINKKRYFKATYFIPKNPGNQTSIIGQGMEQIIGALWKPILFWMA
ncbi:unnamed protein product [Rotaria magnacalcarata]|uniref:Uncharacterized protein n=2 Tax=Rotaria magnacalcarata TaxID=392030 RepID=A0A8S2KI31_9BILA|nr:unnamed protein product [Rotaria magnacalcarata]